ncbi:unnamed protein product [Enterobius vermicularis]|uniref:Sugar transporter SWEET n=1 Tax=Enterobius vermicularis TaxID=51028 RepID=A0A0N4UYJ5_ENTVE|nr:unnamed protein product [Enterobius vermicularis]
MIVLNAILQSNQFLYILSNVAVASTICLFLTGVEICWRISKQNSTDGVSSAPFHMGVISGNLWLQYGLLKGDQTKSEAHLLFKSITANDAENLQAVVKVNVVSSLLYSCYVLYYWMKTKYPAKKTQDRIVLAEGGFLLAITLFLHQHRVDTNRALNFLGALCVTFNIATVAAPLAALHDVIKIRSTENLPLPMCIANLLVTSEWFLYGIMVNDFFIKLPNAVALVISIGQILPFFLYPRKRKSSFSDVEKL